MKETEQTLLDQIKDQVVTDYGYRDWKHFHRGNTRSYDMRFNEIVDNIANRYAEAKAKASCEATLKKASENAKCEPVYDYSEERAELTGYRVKKSSITDPNNITIV